MAFSHVANFETQLQLVKGEGGQTRGHSEVVGKECEGDTPECSSEAPTDE